MISLSVCRPTSSLPSLTSCLASRSLGFSVVRRPNWDSVHPGVLPPAGQQKWAVKAVLTVTILRPVDLINLQLTHTHTHTHIHAGTHVITH